MSQKPSRITEYQNWLKNPSTMYICMYACIVCMYAYGYTYLLVCTGKGRDLCTYVCTHNKTVYLCIYNMFQPKKGHLAITFSATSRPHTRSHLHLGTRRQWLYWSSTSHTFPPIISIIQDSTPSPPFPAVCKANR